MSVLSGDMLSQKMFLPERGVTRWVISTLKVNGEMRRTKPCKEQVLYEELREF